MAIRQTFLTAFWSETWKQSYSRLSAAGQAACDQAAIALIKQASSPGLRIKPIHPDKYYLEARIGSGDRIVFRREEGTIYLVDVVHHDDIDRYGKRPRTRG
jgi:hypothetical protein